MYYGILVAKNRVGWFKSAMDVCHMRKADPGSGYHIDAVIEGANAYGAFFFLFNVHNGSVDSTHASSLPLDALGRFDRDKAVARWGSWGDIEPENLLDLRDGVQIDGDVWFRMSQAIQKKEDMHVYKGAKRPGTISRIYSTPLPLP